MVSFELKKNTAKTRSQMELNTPEKDHRFSLFADQCLPIEDFFQYLFSWSLIFLLFMVIDDMSFFLLDES